MEKNHHPIDTGYSWVAVLGAAIGFFVLFGNFKSMGIIFVEVLNKFEASQGLTALMMGVIGAGLSICSPIMMTIALRCSMRAVVMSGGLLMALSSLLCSFAPNIYYVVFIFGTLLGVSCACIYAPSLVVVGQYFDKRRSIAIGLAMAGGSVGQLTFPFFVTYLFEHFNFQNAMIVYGAFCLHIVVGGALLRPTSFYDRKHQDVKLKQAGENPDGISTETHTTFENESVIASHMKNDTSLCNSTGSLNLTAYPTMGSTDKLGRLNNLEETVINGRHDIPNGSINPEVGKKCQCVCCGPLKCGLSRRVTNCQCITYDTSVLKNYLFMVYLLGICLGQGGHISMIMFIPALSKDIGLTKETAALLLSICGGTDFFGRIIGGWFADLDLITRSKQMGIGLIVSAIIGLVCAFFLNFASMVALVVTLGLVGGIYASLMPVVLVDFIGAEKFPSAFAITVTCLGLFNLAPPAIFGKIRDITGSYTLPYCLCSVMMFLGGSVFLLEPIVRKLQERKDKGLNRKPVN